MRLLKVVIMWKRVEILLLFISFLKAKIFNLFILKLLQIIFAQMTGITFEREDNIVEKGENAFPIAFEKSFP